MYLLRDRATSSIEYPTMDVSLESEGLEIAPEFLTWYLFTSRIHIKSSSKNSHFTLSCHLFWFQIFCKAFLIGRYHWWAIVAESVGQNMRLAYGHARPGTSRPLLAIWRLGSPPAGQFVDNISFSCRFHDRTQAALTMVTRRNLAWCSQTNSPWVDLSQALPFPPVLVLDLLQLFVEIQKLCLQSLTNGISLGTAPGRAWEP